MGTLWSWGSNSYSELGNGTATGARVYELPDLATGKEGAQVGAHVYNQVTKSYYLTNGSDAISTADTSGVAVGATVIGNGIPANTVVTDVQSGTSITLSNNATYTGLASGLSFFQILGTSRSNWMLVGGGGTARTATTSTINN